LPTFPLPITRLLFDWQEQKTLVVLGNKYLIGLRAFPFKIKFGRMATSPPTISITCFSGNPGEGHVYQEVLTWPSIIMKILLLELCTDFAIMYIRLRLSPSFFPLYTVPYRIGVVVVLISAIRSAHIRTESNFDAFLIFFLGRKKIRDVLQNKITFLWAGEEVVFRKFHQSGPFAIRLSSNSFVIQLIQ